MYKVKVKYTFDVVYTFDGPKDMTEAVEWANNHVGMTANGMNTKLRDTVCEWEMDPNPIKKVIRIWKNK